MKRIKTLLAAGAGFGLGWAYLQYRQQRADQIRRLEAGSQMMQLPQGALEYTSLGEGPAVLLLHGGGAGYDLGVAFSWPEWGYRFLSVSRPGYLRTPLSSGVTFEEQADLLAELLDALAVGQAVVVGMSAGGPIALQFALRHPGRCRGLLMMSAASQRTAALPPFLQRMIGLFKVSDFIFWLVMFTPIFALIDRGKMSSLVANDPIKKALLRAVLASMFPFSRRVDGALNDLQRIAELPDLSLAQIRCPTLVAHADTDTIVPYRQAQYTANSIPGAELLTIKGADHLFGSTHLEIFQPAYRAFLERCWKK